MSTANFIPTIWNSKIQRVNHDNLVAKKICNREGEGEIKQAGDTVKFNGLAKPTISSYSGSVTYENLKDASAVLHIDQQNYFAFKVGDIEKAQANVDLKGSQASEAAFGLAEVADSYVLGLYAQCLRTITDASCDTASIISTLGLAKQYLAEVNVRQNDMWMCIPPWVQLKLELAGIVFQINNGISGEGGMAWTNKLGFDMFVTNQVPNTNTVVAPVSEIMAGSYNAIVYADQLVKTQYFEQMEDGFDSAVRGLHVFGAKMIRPDHVVRLTLSYTAETTI